ncbi:MAG: 50S ribosomal protein L24 [Thermoprotei archaeon]|nr:MAG: 50S ribosomal protein L24 [Thermoprotei archaeon]
MGLTKSKQPRKQRKNFYNASLHLRHKFFNVPLAEGLQAKHGIKRLPVRKGDTVKIVRGDWRGHEGKVVKVDYEKVRLHIEGVTVKKADGTLRFHPIHPSKVVITKLGPSDKYRTKIIERRKGGEEAG